MGAHGDDDAPDPVSPAAPPAPMAYETTRVLGPGGGADAPTADRAARSSVAAGTRIGRYELGALLGQGGMGQVFRARDRELDRALAIKLVHPDGDPGHARVLREAQAMARLRHAHVVPVFDVGIHDGRVFLVMPLLEGGTLGSWLRARARPWREVLPRFVAAARGLAAAHAVGLIHRDFKPDNVLLGDGDEVQVADFGLARAARDEAAGPVASSDRSVLAADVTAAGMVLGTPAYMAPEQLDGGVLDARADQFSFCVALYEALHGRRPFERDDSSVTDLTTLRAAIKAGPLRPGKGDGDVPGWLRAFVLRGLREEPAARWPSMTALIDAIERRRHRPRRIALVALGVVALAGAAAVTLVAVRGRGDRGARGAASPSSSSQYVIDRAARVTFGGCVAQPALAPDGQQLAYVQRRGVVSTLITAEVGATGARELGPGTEPAFSPDGRYLAALDRGQVVIHDLRTPAAPVTTLGASTSGPSFLDDGTIVVGVGDQVIARAVADGAERVLGRVPGGHVVRATAVGADHRVFVIHRPDAMLAEAIVAELLADGTTRELRRGVLSTAGLRYHAERGVVYYVQRRNSNQYQLFVQAVDGGEVVTPFALETPPTGGFDVARGERRLAFSSCAESATIAAIPRTGTPAPLTARGTWRDNAPLVIDDARLIHTSNRAGRVQLWLLDRKTGDAQPLVEPESSQPALSPDHVTLAYATVEGGGLLGLRAAPLAAIETVRTLTAGHVDRAPRFTRDGTSIIFLRETAAGQGLYRVAATGGEAGVLGGGALIEARAFDVSPQNDTIVVVAPRGDQPLSTMTVDGRDRAPLRGTEGLGANLRAVRFSPDGGRVLTVDADGRMTEVTLATGAVRPRWQLDDSEFSAVGAIDYDVDGDTVIASLTARAGDLWIADGRF